MLVVLSIVTCIILLISFIETLIGLRSMNSLKDVNIKHGSFPKLSIIVTACNEEDNIAQTLSALEKQSYLNLEIICVNDRSSDDTGKIINSFARQKNSRIKQVRIDNLPQGWLGKNYASHIGSEFATGQWLLFMDADVHIEADSLKRAISYVIRKKLDHLSVLAHYFCQGILYNVVHLVHKGHGFVIPLKPWLAKSKRSKKSFNLGVFCLVSKEAYHICGGHKAIPLECVDDFRLGQRIKEYGFSQEVLNAQEDISIEWYPTLRDMIDGLKKNVFSYFDYKLAPIVFGMLAWYILFAWPVIACFVTHGMCQSLNIVSSLIMLLMNFEVARFFKIPWRYVLIYPVGLIVYPYIVVSSVVYFFSNNGIYWRGTFYPASILKKNVQAKKKKY